MFRPKILWLLATGVVSMALLGAGVMGISRLNVPVDDFPELDQQQHVGDTVGELTEIVAVDRCPLCGKAEPLAATGQLFGRWYGMNRAQLEKDLATNYPQWSVTEFSSSRVVVERTPQRCNDCKSLWPQRGYIGLHEDKIAVYTEEGLLVEVLEPAPGAWYESLQQGIPFDSPEECEQLLFNLTS